MRPRAISIHLQFFHLHLLFASYSSLWVEIHLTEIVDITLPSGKVCESSKLFLMELWVSLCFWKEIFEEPEYKPFRSNCTRTLN